MHHQRVRAELDEVCLGQRGDNGVEMLLEEREQRVVGDVAGRHDQQPLRGSRQQVAVSEVAILGDHNPIISIGLFRDPCIRRSVAVGQIRGVQRIMT